MSSESPTTASPIPAPSRGSFWTLRHDLMASLVVFLVALPLCMGIAIASGVPVAAGLITGIVGGLVVGFLAGCPLQVSGPAAGLTVIVFDLVERHGLETLGLAVLAGGIIQLAAGLLRLGQWFRAVSPAVVQGMLAGIGILILASQFHVMVDDTPQGSGIQNLVTIPQAIQKGLPLPTWTSREERQSRSSLLRGFGMIHEQQVQIRELVAEHLGGNAGPSHDISDLAKRQETLNNSLAELAEQAAAHGADHPEFENRDELQSAVDHALQQCDTAWQILEQGAGPQLRSSQEHAQRALETVLQRLKSHAWAAKIGLLSLLLLVTWQLIAPGPVRFLPGPLVAILVATLLAAILQLPVLYVELPDNLWTEVHFPSWTTLQAISFRELLTLGIVLAAVASAETLLCATAVDQMLPGVRTNYDRELAAQGVGNILCGSLGALPMTGVIVRSAANVQSGAQTRWSAILHGAWLLLFVTFLGFLLRMIPTAGLAAILVYTGYKLVNPKAVRKLRDYGWGEVAIYAVTVGTIVATDLLTGVLTGIVLSAGKLLYRFSHLHAELKMVDHHKAVLTMEGAATFIRLPQLAQVLEQVPANAELHLDFEHLSYVDHACLDLLMNWARQHESSGGSLVIDWESLHAQFHSSPPGNQRPRRPSATRNPP